MSTKPIDSLTINDLKPITISFKKNEDELILYKWILRHSGYSGFVKDTLRTIMENEKNEIVDSNQKSGLLKEMTVKEQNSSLIELDF